MPPPEPARPGRDIEGWLRSPWRRALLVLGLVAIATAVTTSQLQELRAARGREDAVWPLALQQLVDWLAWALAGWPILRLAGFLWRRLPHWTLFLLLQAPLSYFVAQGFVQLQLYTAAELYERTTERRATERLERFDRFARGVADGEAEDGTPAARGDRPPQAERERGGGRDEPPQAERRERPPRPNRGDDRFGRSGRWERWFRRPWPMALSRALFVYWAILGLGALVASYLRGRDEEQRRAELELREAHLKAELNHAQVDALRSQLQPHFLFNSLHAVGGLIREGEGESALRTLSALGQLLRTTLEVGRAKEVPLAEELALARRYLDVERIRFGERIRVEWDADPTVEEALVPVMLLLPLVENAVRYAVAARSAGGTVRIAARPAGERVRIEVSDDGPGFPAEVLARAGAPDEVRAGEHVGLANTRARLAGLYGDHASFELSNPPGGGARVRIELAYRAAPGEDDDAA